MAILKMEFFHVVDPVTLAPVSYARVALELALAVVCTVLLGACLQVLPERLLRYSQTARAKVPREAVAVGAAAAATKPAMLKKLSTTASATPSPSSTAPPAPPKTAPSAPPAALAERTLDDVLESFFEGESLLTEALIDATAHSSTPTEETPPANTTAGKPTQPSPPKTSDFSSDLAAKMTRGLQSQARLATAAPPPKRASKLQETGDTADKRLEDALDAYMEEEQLLDEAVLDSALEAAHTA
nr:unnamed protein product [Leishmania braziliensis]